MITSPFASLLALALTLTAMHRESVQELQPALYGAGCSPDPYAVAVRKALLDAGSRPKCLLLVVPSFEREWCAFLARDSAAPPELVFRAMKRHLESEIMDVLSANGTRTEVDVGWEARARALKQIPIEVDTSRAYIDPETADVLEQVWWRMLGRVQYPEDPSEGLDGVTYYFAHGIPPALRCGEIWSPEKGTRARALVDIGMRMRDLATAPPKSRPAFERVLLQQANALLKRIDEAAESGLPR